MRARISWAARVRASTASSGCGIVPPLRQRWTELFYRKYQISRFLLEIYRRACIIARPPIDPSVKEHASRASPCDVFRGRRRDGCRRILQPRELARRADGAGAERARARFT